MAKLGFCASLASGISILLSTIRCGGRGGSLGISTSTRSEDSTARSNSLGSRSHGRVASAAGLLGPLFLLPYKNNVHGFVAEREAAYTGPGAANAPDEKNWLGMSHSGGRRVGGQVNGWVSCGRWVAEC